MSQIELKGVRKSYGDVDIIKGVDITIEQGEFAVFVGPSGCGKSTLLRMVAGLEEITAGEFRLGGQLMNHIPPDKRGIAMVFQSYALYPHMTVAENIGFGLSLQKVPKPEIRKRVKEVAEILHLEDLLPRKPAQLSGGQRQRVAIGRAIAKRPEVILFDEPLSNLDAMLRVQMRAEIQKLHQEFGSTIIYVTHDQVEAMTMAEKIVVLNQGLVSQVGDPIDLYRKPENTFVAEFIGSPRMNMMPAVVKSRSADGIAVNVQDSVLSFRGDYRVEQGDALQLGIRPEHIRVADSATPQGLTLKVALVERLGAETYLHLECDHRPIVVRVEGDFHVDMGANVTIEIDTEWCHLFDARGARFSITGMPTKTASTACHTA
ncbi:ABC transporter ATP-binding protein [Microbulbifer sp.]|uniref:ABC transporter ATP-binding protein n=1 Tax=Microbulbifer sp. TaxID=1908541 RepID=UPI003F2CF995